MLKAYWRLFEESATVFVNKFRNNLFRKTQVTFLAALFLIGVANIVSLAIMANTTASSTFDAIFTRWGTVLVQDVPSPSFTILDLQKEVDATKLHYLSIISAANILGLLLIGLIGSRVVLEPTRDAISAQRNFIAHTAHELRTPLSIARTNIEVTLLEAATVSKESCLNEFRKTLIELDALAGIINNLVMLNTLSNLEPAEYQYHDLDEVIREVAETYREFKRSKAITLTVESEKGLLVWSNRNALKQMVSNLVGNAINFTAEQGTVTVRASQYSPRYIRLLVIDSGIGIAKDELPFIFKPFYRSPSVLGKNDGGSGLGLSIVRELVRLHHGRIKFQSVLGEGTTATIDLPIIQRRARLFSRNQTSESTNAVSFNYSRGKDVQDF